MSVDIRFTVRSPKGHAAGSTLRGVEMGEELAGWIEAGVAVVLNQSIEVPLDETSDAEITGDGSGVDLPPYDEDNPEQTSP